MVSKNERLSPLRITTHKGSVTLTDGNKSVGKITPEVFSEGWRKNVVDEALQSASVDGLIPAGKKGSVGLKTQITLSGETCNFKFKLCPLSPVEVIHVRIVLSLPYGDWTGGEFRLGQQKGIIRAERRADPKISEGKSKVLSLGPSRQELRIKLRAPGLLMVLQDNRQWTPFLQAFVTGKEPSDRTWKWKKGEEKTYSFSLWVNHGVVQPPKGVQVRGVVGKKTKRRNQK